MLLELYSRAANFLLQSLRRWSTTSQMISFLCWWSQGTFTIWILYNPCWLIIEMLRPGWTQTTWTLIRKEAEVQTCWGASVLHSTLMSVFLDYILSTFSVSVNVHAKWVQSAPQWYWDTNGWSYLGDLHRVQGAQSHLIKEDQTAGNETRWPSLVTKSTICAWNQMVEKKKHKVCRRRKCLSVYK